jgi:hypothetical protein
MVLLYAPPPVPFDVFEFAVVGSCDVLQQTPFSVTSSVQLPDSVPPDTPDIEDMELMDVVVSIGNIAVVVKRTSGP